MARGTRRQSEQRQTEQLSVEELLRQSGATARRTDEAASASLPPRPVLRDHPAMSHADAEAHRQRLERQAREAAFGQQRVGARIWLITAVSGAVIVLGTLAVLGLTSKSEPPAGSSALPFIMLQPATGQPSTPTTTKLPAPQTVVPIPTVITATETTPASKSAAPGTSTHPAPPKPPAPRPAGCSVHYAVQSSWDGGFSAAIAVVNNTDAPISSWSLGWTYTAGQRVTQGWDGTFSQSGSRVTVDAPSWSTDVPPGGSVTAGFNGSFGRSNPAPTGFSVNGVSCSVI
jgi:hypothetical protein